MYQSQIYSNDSVHTSSAVAFVFKSRSGQSKDYDISSWCYQVNTNRSTQKTKKMSNMDTHQNKFKTKLRLKLDNITISYYILYIVYTDSNSNVRNIPGID